MAEQAAAAIPAEFEDLFRGDALAQPATLRPDGTPTLTPVWSALGDHRVAVTARADRHEARTEPDSRTTSDRAETPTSDHRTSTEHETAERAANGGRTTSQ